MVFFLHYYYYYRYYYRLLLKVMSILVVISVILCITAFVYLLKSGQNVKAALSFTVVLLVASIPVAIEIVCTTTLALGSRELAKEGAIVSRLAAIEDMAGMSILCSDKTGTLTLNKMVIQKETPMYVEVSTADHITLWAQQHHTKSTCTGADEGLGRD